MRFLPGQRFFQSKRVLLRVDFNVGIEKNQVIDDFDIQRALKTIRHVNKFSRYTLLISHLGNSKEGGRLSSLWPVAQRLAELMHKEVYFVSGTPKSLKTSLAVLPPGSLALLENIRFYAGEYARGNYVNSSSFAKSLAELGDCFVNEAFGESHRKVSSICGLPKYLPSFAGFNLQAEVENLGRFKKHPARPWVVVLGGAKLKTRLPLLKKLVNKADAILLGGGVANTFLAAQNLKIGRSLQEREFIPNAKRLLSRKNLILPKDFFTADSKSARRAKIFLPPTGQLKASDYILDIGPESTRLFSQILKNARTIFWNGPLGYAENPLFTKGSRAVAKAISRNNKAYRVIGGGETVAFLRNSGIRLENSGAKNIFISTGGGAMLEYLTGKELPGLKALSQKSVK